MCADHRPYCDVDVVFRMGDGTKPARQSLIHPLFQQRFSRKKARMMQPVFRCFTALFFCV